MKHVLVIVLCVLVLAGCAPLRWVGILPPAPEAPGVGSDAPPPGGDPDALGPFPWGWTFGILSVGAMAVGALLLLKLPSLVDEAIAATVGAVAFIVTLELVREAWHAKWMLLGAFVVLMLLLAAWKLGRRWWHSRAAPSGLVATENGN